MVIEVSMPALLVIAALKTWPVKIKHKHHIIINDQPDDEILKITSGYIIVDAGQF